MQNANSLPCELSRRDPQFWTKPKTLTIVSIVKAREAQKIAFELPLRW